MQEKRFRAAVEFEIVVKDMPERGPGQDAEQWQRQRRLLHALLNDEEALRRYALFSLWGELEAGHFINDENFRGQFETHGDFYIALQPILSALPPEDAEAFAAAEEHQVFLEHVEEVVDAFTVEAGRVRLEPVTDEGRE